MDRRKLWKSIRIVAIALSLLVTVGLAVGQAAGPKEDSTPTSTRELPAGGGRAQLHGAGGNARR